jgi:hypothetical protein
MDQIMYRSYGDHLFLFGYPSYRVSLDGTSLHSTLRLYTLRELDEL